MHRARFVMLAAFAVGGVGSGCVVHDGAVLGELCGDTLCGPTETCIDGECVPTGTGGCNDGGAPCLPGEICSPDGTCVPDTGCDTNQDCDPGSRCVDGECVESGGCETNADCANGFDCIDGECVFTGQR